MRMNDASPNQSNRTLAAVATFLLIVVVLMTNCHVSEKLKKGPVMAHKRMTPSAMPNAQWQPRHSAVPQEKRRNHSRQPAHAVFFMPKGTTRIAAAQWRINFQEIPEQVFSNRVGGFASAQTGFS